MLRETDEAQMRYTAMALAADVYKAELAHDIKDANGVMELADIILNFLKGATNE